MSYQRGDVVWGPDPFKSGENPRPWLIQNNDTHPFGDEEYMTVTLTTTPHDEGISLDDADWVEGGMPRQSYASPWAVASPKHAAIVRRQGRLKETFVQTVVVGAATNQAPVAIDFAGATLSGCSEFVAVVVFRPDLVPEPPPELLSRRDELVVARRTEVLAALRHDLQRGHVTFCSSPSSSFSTMRSHPQEYVNGRGSTRWSP